MHTKIMGFQRQEHKCYIDAARGILVNKTRVCIMKQIRGKLKKIKVRVSAQPCVFLMHWKALWFLLLPVFIFAFCLFAASSPCSSLSPRPLLPHTQHDLLCSCRYAKANLYTFPVYILKVHLPFSHSHKTASQPKCKSSINQSGIEWWSYLWYDGQIFL